MSSPAAGSVPATFARALDALRARFSPTTIAIACSGGLDSMVLLHLASGWCREHGHTLLVFHVHHGLSTNADAWQRHVEASAAALGVRAELSDP